MKRGLPIAVILAAILALNGCGEKPPVTPGISGVAADPSLTGALITWSTDTPTTSQVSYGIASGACIGTSPVDAALTTGHGVALTGLTPGTTYYFAVKSVGEDGGEAVSAETSFTTLDFGISGVTVENITQNSAAVSWTTGLESTSELNYHSGTSVLISLSSEAPVALHTMQLTGLSPSTTYYFAVNSKCEGVERISEGNSFTTASEPLAILGLGKSSTATAITLTFATNFPATSQVFYSTDNSFNLSNARTAILVSSHSVTIEGLSPNTNYHCRIQVWDAADNLAMANITVKTDR